MEKRLVVAVLLMVGVVYLVNIFFPPAPPVRPVAESETDSAAAPQGLPIEVAPEAAPAETVFVEAEPQPADAEDRPPVLEASGGDTIWVEGPLYRLAFSTRGAALITAEMLDYESLAPTTRGAAVQLVPEGVRETLTHGWVVGSDTLDLADATFQVRPAAGVRIDEGGMPQTLTFTYRHPDADFSFELRYTFYAGSYEMGMTGRLSGVPATGWWLVNLGVGLESNEWDPEADYRDYLAFVAKGGNSPLRERFKNLNPGERTTLDGPFDWVAVHSKYFASALVLPPEAGEDARFAGLQITSLLETSRARGVASFPVSRSGTFDYSLYIGPLSPRGLAAVGRDLNQVASFGYKWLQPVIRPLSVAITDLVVWSHKTLGLGYGWVLILFGVGIRIVLFPLYQKSMRSQMATMRVQPLMKEIQAKYKHDPQKLQQEMIKLYREHKINPLGGCLPMLLPFPILIALFFVFKDTIEFRGVPFLWLPDLSRPDPLFIVPVLMGASLFVLQWIGQRGMPQNNPQMKMIMYVMPVMMVVLFYKFAAGLNLYYATMNLASLPQQLYLAKERKAATASVPPPPKPTKKAAKARS